MIKPGTVITEKNRIGSDPKKPTVLFVLKIESKDQNYNRLHCLNQDNKTVFMTMATDEHALDRILRFWEVYNHLEL
jgi:hypothetical protein